MKDIGCLSVSYTKKTKKRNAVKVINNFVHLATCEDIPMLVQSVKILPISSPIATLSLRLTTSTHPGLGQHWSTDCD